MNEEKQRILNDTQKQVGEWDATVLTRPTPHIWNGIDLSKYVQGEITDVSSNPFDEDTLWVYTTKGTWLLKISELA